jgi:hypothetical protein
MEYDSTQDTLNHIEMVRSFMLEASENIISRAMSHDESKLLPPEKALFDEQTPKLKSLTYGSEEYKQALKDLKPALDNHYKVNSHHPEHYENGVKDMNLFDLIEMLCDWKAATLRHDDGDFNKSMAINKERFSIPDDLFLVLEKTALHMGLYRTEFEEYNLLNRG